MAQASRKVRAARRTKRKLSQQRRMVGAIRQDFQRTYLTLLYVLAQSGGTIEVTHGTMLQVMKVAAKLRWQARDKVDDPNVVVVSLVEPEPTDDGPSATEPPVKRTGITITRLPDDDDMVAPVPDVLFDDHADTGGHVHTAVPDVHHDPTHPDHEVARFAGEGNPHDD